MAETEWETWETLPEGGHFHQWKPVGYPVQEYVCVEGTLFDIDTANSVGDCNMCKDTPP